RRRHTICYRDWSSDVCSSDLIRNEVGNQEIGEVGLALDDTPAALLKALVNERFHGQVGHLANMRPQADLFQSFRLSQSTRSKPRSEERRVGKGGPARLCAGAF